jgi:hypothetical protein
MVKLFRKTLAKYSVATPEVEFPVYDRYILPHFKSFILADNSSDPTKATLSYNIPNDLVAEAGIGVAIFENNERNQIKYHALKHKDAMVSGINYKFDFTGLDATKKYIAKPVVNLFGSIEVVADQEIELKQENSDRAILMKFYRDTGGDNWVFNDNWCSDKPLDQWHGVSTNSEGRVTSIELDYNNLTGNADLRGLTALTDLICNDNQLSSLDVSGCTALTHLYCFNNQLTSLDVSGCTALTHLECSYNQLTSLDVLSGCTALQVLSCNDNQLTSLDVLSGCTALQVVHCRRNQLTALDVSGDSTALTWLECYNSQLTSLDVSGCTALARLECGGGQLNTHEASGCTAQPNVE